jgi:hypothetical protein
LDLIAPSLTTTIESIYTFIEKIVKIRLAVRAIEGNMSATAILPLAVIVRLEWIKKHPQTMFDPQDPVHLFAIKELYLRFRGDWLTDELFGGTGI